MDRCKSIDYRDDRELPVGQLVALYAANGWSAADKPELLRAALLNSHSLFAAWDAETLVGVANAISDGHLVVYYPHLIVHPDYHRRGIGTALMSRLLDRYDGFHQQMLVADGNAVEFYRSLGFRRAGRTEPMWIYEGTGH